MTFRRMDPSYQFQSTLSVRRATGSSATRSTRSAFQSTLSVRRATTCYPQRDPERVFQSTLSVRRATRFGRQLIVDVLISIHALREESDTTYKRIRECLGDFNPRSP